MSNTTVGEFALELRKTPDTLMEQLAAAGVLRTSPTDVLTDVDKLQLLQYLQGTHSTGDGRKKITLVKKPTTEFKQAVAQERPRTIQVEIRKKRTFEQAKPVVVEPKTLKIERIQAKAFKAFRNFDFELKGRNLLAYGANGAGKSSLYWLLYTFLQSGQKPLGAINKYFEPQHKEGLLNVHATEPESQQAHITLTLQSEDGGSTGYCISAKTHETQNKPAITIGNIASDFVTYRTLFNFYQARHSQTIDLWPVFKAEILPFVTPPGAIGTLGDMWAKIEAESNILKEAKTGKAKKIVLFDEQIDSFNIFLASALNSILAAAQDFYNKHFESGDTAPFKLLLGITNKASPFDPNSNEFSEPVIGFSVQIGASEPMARPHTFLNEAKLTQLALSVRFGATLTKPNDPSLKLLVVDDLLISLDMNNRMPVVDIILGDDFKDYQKIILTHDIGFFKEFRRRIGQAHTDWSFQRFRGSADEQIALVVDKSDLEKAQDYLNGGNLDEAAVSLRKAADETAKRLREYHEGKKLPSGEFHSLTENLRMAKNKLLEQTPYLVHQKLVGGTEKEVLEQLVPKSDSDITGSPEIINKATQKRRMLRQHLLHDGWQAYENIRIINDLLESTERVLNPGAHGGEVTLHAHEVNKALELIRQLAKIAT